MSADDEGFVDETMCGALSYAHIVLEVLAARFDPPPRPREPRTPAFSSRAREADHGHRLAIAACEIAAAAIEEASVSTSMSAREFLNAVSERVLARDDADDRTV